MVLYHSNVVISASLLALSTMLLVSYVNNYGGSFLPWASHACAQECLETYFHGAPRSQDPAILEVVRQKYIFPPPHRPNTDPFDINEPIWSKLVDWNLMQQKLMEIWQGEPPGVFVEVGAADGEFMSQTLMLEKNLSWTGLLVEPDPRSFAIMQKRRRNAWTSPLCIHHSPPYVRKYWLRDPEEDLPQHFQQLLMARSKLDTDTLVGDEERGKTVMLPCVPLSTVLIAANITSIDFLTICTGSDEDDARVSDVINSRKFDVKTVLIHYPMGPLLADQYPTIPGYILDLEHSTLLMKLFIRRSSCQLVSKDECRRINTYDTRDACYKYLCFDFLTVWTVESKTRVVEKV